MAHLIQFPHKKVMTALVIKGKQGSGKNVVFDPLRLCLIGKNLCKYIENPDEAFGTWTAIYKDKIFVLYDEASGKDTFSNSERLKTMITGLDFSAQQKNVPIQDAYPNLTNWVFLSNNLSPINKQEGCRRYFCFRTNDSMANNRVYFKPFYDMFDLPNHCKNPCLHSCWAIYQWLKNIDVSNFDPVNHRPVTTFDSNMVQFDPVLRFLEDLGSKAVGKKVKMQPQQLFNIYTEWMKDRKMEGISNVVQFGKKLEEYNAERAGGFLHRTKRRIQFKHNDLIAKYPAIVYDDNEDDSDSDDDKTDEESDPPTFLGYMD